jgi:hypothetical protein
MQWCPMKPNVHIGHPALFIRGQGGRSEPTAAAHGE